MTRPGDDRRDISKRSGGPTRLGATGGHAAGPTTGSAAAAAARTNREGAPFAFATHKGALQSPADDDDEFYYDSTLTDSNDDPSRSLEDAADWSHTLDSPSESNINKTIIRTSNPNRNESPAWLQTPISGPQRRSLNSCYASRGRQPPLVLEQEFEVGISEDETHQVVEIEEVEETDDFESDVDREGDEIDEEKHWDPPAPPPGHRLCHYHVTETIGTAEAVAYTIKAAAKPVVTAKHVPAPEPVITAKHVPTPEPVITVKHVPTPDPVITVKHVPTREPVFTLKRAPTRERVFTVKHVPTREPAFTAKHVPTPEPVIAVKHVPSPEPVFTVKHVPTSDPLITVKRVPTPEPAAAIAMIKTERVVTKPKPTRPTVPMIFSDTCSIERRTLKDRPTLTGSSVPISSLVAETTAKNVRTAGSIYGSAGFLSGPSSRKVQYNRQPEVHEYTKDSSGSCMGTRLEWKRQQDGVVLVDVGPPLTKEEEAERRRMQREMEAWQKQDKAQQGADTKTEAESKKPAGPSSESVLRVPDQARSSASIVAKPRPPVAFETHIVNSKTGVAPVGSPSRVGPNIVEVLEECSCDGETKYDSSRERGVSQSPTHPEVDVIADQLPACMAGRHTCIPQAQRRQFDMTGYDSRRRPESMHVVHTKDHPREPFRVGQEDCNRPEPTFSARRSSQVNTTRIRADRSDSTRVLGEETSERRRTQHFVLEPPDHRFHGSRQASSEFAAGRVARARSYEQPWEPPGHEQSRRRALSPHVNMPTNRPLERFFSERAGPDRLLYERGAERSSYNAIQSQRSPFDLSPLGPKPSPMEAAARNAWKQYSREYERYLSNLNEWNCQQEILRNKLGAKASGPMAPLTGAGQVPPKPPLLDPTALGSQINPEVDEDGVRIRIAVSANNLRRNRSPECQDTDRQPGVNRAEVSRSHKLRASTEQPEPTIFNEVEDNRVHVTALCKEHMSLRGVTVPPSLPSPPAGRSAAGHGSMVATTGTYAEGKHYGDSFGRTERPGPNPTLSRKLRRHIMYAPQLKTGVPRDFLVYFLVSMTTLASIFAAIGVFSQHESSEHLDENPLQNSPGPSYSVNFSEPLSLRLSRRLTKTKNFSVCKTIECQREGAYLASTLNWALDPCADFHAFVCRSSRATRLQEVEQRVAVRLRQPSLSAPLVHLQRLRRECLEPKGRSWSQLRGLLDVLALEGWPFADSRNVSHDRVWEVAANLERRLGIASLLAVSRQPGSKLLVLNTAPVWSRGEDDFMTSRYHKFAGALRGEPAIDTLSQATQVVQLARELSDLPSKSSMVRTRIRDSPYKLFLSSLINTSDSEDQGHLDVLFSRQLASQLTKLLDRVEPHVILNYQGFLVSLSVEPLLPGANSSEPQCWRLVEDALPELFLYAAFLDQRSVMAAVSNMTDTVKRNVMLYVNSASWMEASVRRESVERLRELRVHAFVPPWFWAANRVRVQFGKLTQVGSSKGITAMAAFKEQSQGRLLRGDAWPTAPTDSRCAYDSSMRTVYLPLLAANLSGSPAEPLTLTRLPRMGPQLAACLLHVVTSGAGRWWGARTVRNLQPLRKCVVSQAPEEADPDQLLEQLAALAPVHNIYDERVRARSAQDRDYRLQHAENVTSAQLFFVYYGMAQCHASPERVNLPLQNYEPFRKAFGCRIGTFMAPANTCRFWAA